MENKQQLSPYQEGVAKALKEMGQAHVNDAMQQGVPAEHIEQQAGISTESQQVLNELLTLSKAKVSQSGTRTGLIPALLNMAQGKGFDPMAPQTEELGPEKGLQVLTKALELKKMNDNKNLNMNPDDLANMLNTYNAALPEEYQAVQTADGRFVARPKASGALAQLNPEQLDSLSDSMLGGELAPSQLSRLQRNQVMSAALQKDASFNPAKSDIDFAVNKVGASNFEKLYNNVTSFEKTFRKNADVALSLSDSFDRTKIPLLNKAIMAGKLNITGDPEASKMATALYTVATEYARLTSSPGATGSMITDSARQEARDLLNTWQNKGTIKEQLDPEYGIMSIDTKNRLAALNETRDDIRSRVGGKKKDAAPTAPKTGGWNSDKETRYQELLKKRGK